MSDKIKLALIITGGIVIAMALYIYYSPYQTCVRGQKASGSVIAASDAHIICAQYSN